MASKDKKLTKLKERLATLEQEMISSLTKKSSSTVEISVADYTRKIQELKKQIASM